MEYSMSSDQGIITTSSLSSSSSSASPSSSSSPSTNYPPSPPPPAVTSPPESSSSSSSPDSPPPDLPPAAVTSLPVVVISSCAACKYLGRSCVENCVLATCFPPDDLVKFSSVHRVFGASNIIKILQELSESQREDAVSSMVYEAIARLRDPVYGCVGAIFHLQGQVQDLLEQLAKAQAELVNMQIQQANLMAQVCTEMGQSPQASPQQSLDNFINIPMSFLDENNNLGSPWEPLWT